MKNITRILILATILSSCSYQPKLLPNDHLLQVGKDQSQKDITECLELAKLYGQDAEKWQEVAKQTAKGSVIGAAAGAVGGAIVHSAGRGVAIGAASGAVAALVNELFKLGEGDPTEQRFTDYCLEKRGYAVVH